ncbi:MAG TPA: D-alanine--D-alanine ligase family protein [Thermoleophilaceae bacterium]|nr:D-alanine--D-alanine ligase family protein [Thermoleophilaceae bacterium]
MRVAVLGGGPSGEHEVSLSSAAAIADGLVQAGHEPLRVTIGRDGRWSHEGVPVALEPAGGLLGCEVAFPALHGPYGEDGVVQGLLEALAVPYVGAAVAASAICVDKILFKDAMAVAGVPQVGYAAVRAPDGWRADGDRARAVDPADLERVAALGLPVFVKPARLGSSVGISKVTVADELPAALAAAWEHDRLAIVEAMSHGLEIECALIGNADPQVSMPGEIEIDADWYDYEAKYTEGGMRLIVPARIPARVADSVRSLAADVFRRVDCAGLARCDFFVEDPEGDARILVNELNTMPGFTPTSVFPKLWGASGLAYPDLLDRLLALALERISNR